VKQGCPLSPLLFNLCIEPLLQAVGDNLGRCGAFVGPPDAEERIGLTVQAYADDVVFVSRSARDMQTMLGKLEEFERWAGMEVNVDKCATASYAMDAQGHRCTIEHPVRIRGQGIRNLTLAQSLKYLGTAVAARRTVKLQAVETKLTEMRVRLRKIMESPLLIVQKVDAVKTFLLPMIDFVLLNGDVGESQLVRMDQNIRAAVDRALKVHGLPVECHHASWRDGGLSYPSLVDRRRVLMVRSFAQMTLSRDARVREAMRWFTAEERNLRGFNEDPDADFLDWGGNQRGRGTACLAARTRKACVRMKIKLKLCGDEMVLTKNESDYTTKSASGVGHFLTQKVVRPEHYRKLVAKEVHGASYTTLGANEVSNLSLTDVYRYKSDAYFRFLVVGRADLLPTPVNLERWFHRGAQGGDAASKCQRCGKEQRPTLAHLLNGCTAYTAGMIERHDRIVGIIREAVVKFVGRDLQSDIRTNSTIREDGLSEDQRALKPDMVFERSTGKGRVTEILEFSCPYGHMSHDQDTLVAVYAHKTAKYQRLANEVRALRHQPVRVTAVVVSSMGAVYAPSLRGLERVLGCNKRDLQSLGRRMSEAAIWGSMRIWRQVVQSRERGVTYGAEGDSMVAQEVENVEVYEENEERNRGEEEDEGDGNEHGKGEDQADGGDGFGDEDEGREDRGEGRRREMVGITEEEGSGEEIDECTT
jgi:hypothetical protein